jgi:hypothetical protein
VGVVAGLDRAAVRQRLGGLRAAQAVRQGLGKLWELVVRAGMVVMMLLLVVLLLLELDSRRVEVRMRARLGGKRVQRRRQES